MSFVFPQPCDSSVDGNGDCCPVTFIGFCLADSTPISITLQNGLNIGWTNLLTGVFTPGPPPGGTTLCSSGGGGDHFLDCATDSVTVCSGVDPLIISGEIGTLYDYPEDSIHSSGDIGAFILAVRNDAGLPLAADGDYIPFTTDDTGALRVAATVNANVTINSEYPEDSLAVSGDIGSFVLAVRNDAGTPLAADGDYIPFTTDATGALRVAATANVVINSEYPEDSLAVSGDIGSFVLAVRNDAGATLTSTDGDYSPIATDSAGRVGVSDLGGSLTVDGTVTVLQGTTPWTVDGTVELGAATLAALETITVLQGTSPWVTSLDAATLTALESVTVQNGAGAAAVNIQDGGNSITVDATDLDVRDLDFATDSVDVSGSTVALDAGTLTALETITVLQGTSPWVVSGTVSVTVPDSTAISGPTRTTIGGTAVSLLAASASRKRLFIQNVGTTIIYVGLGASAPTTTVYYAAIAPGTTADDGRGSSYIDELWTGEVQAISSAAGGLVVVSELT